MNNIYINGRFLTQSITGVQRYGHELVKTLDTLITKGYIDSNFEFIILTPRKGIMHDLQLKNISICNVGNLSGHAWEQFELPVYSKNGLLFCPCNTAPIISLILRQIVIVTVHDLSYKHYPSAYSRKFRYAYDIINYFILKYARLIITVSHAERDSIQLLYGKTSNRIKVIKHGTLSDLFISKVKEINRDDIVSNRQSMILYVGALSRRKNIHGFVNVANSLLNRQKSENLCFVAAGESGKTFQNPFWDLSETALKNVKFIGQINDTESLIKLYKSATCLVFPSFYESAGLPPIEAMACGCPVIVSAIPALKEYCGEAALYCDPNDIQDIAMKVESLLGNAALRNTLIDKGLENAKQYNWNECTMQTFTLIKRLIDHEI